MRGATVGRNCDLRARVRVDEGAALGDECVVGEEALIGPEVRVYPYKTIEAGAQIRQNLRELPSVTWVEEAPDCVSAAHYLTFTVAETNVRNALLASMHRQGFPLERTWHVVPSYYRGFDGTFPFGSAGSAGNLASEIEVEKEILPQRLLRRQVEFRNNIP